MRNEWVNGFSSESRFAVCSSLIRAGIIVLKVCLVVFLSRFPLPEFVNKWEIQDRISKMDRLIFRIFFIFSLTFCETWKSQSFTWKYSHCLKIAKSSRAIFAAHTWHGSVPASCLGVVGQKTHSWFQRLVICCLTHAENIRFDVFGPITKWVTARARLNLCCLHKCERCRIIN